MTGPTPSSAKQARELVLDDLWQATDDQELTLLRGGHQRHHRLECTVLALRERRLDAGARVVDHADAGQQARVKPLGGLGEIELDHFGRARADQEECTDVRSPLEQRHADAVEFSVGIGQASEVSVGQDRRAEAGLGEDHHASRALQQMRTGPRADDEKEGVLHLAMQPDDAGEPAEHFALTALAQDRLWLQPDCTSYCREIVHSPHAS